MKDQDYIAYLEGALLSVIEERQAIMRDVAIAPVGLNESPYIHGYLPDELKNTIKGKRKERIPDKLPPITKVTIHYCHRLLYILQEQGELNQEQKEWCDKVSTMILYELDMGRW